MSKNISAFFALGVAAFALFFLLYFELFWTELIFLFFFSIVFFLTWLDVEYQILPDPLCYLLLWGGLIVNLNGRIVPLDQAVLGAVWGYLLLWAVYWIFKAVTGKDGLGYGDFKLVAALGAWMGWMALPFLMTGASFLTLLWQGYTYSFYQRDIARPVAFGPSLILVASGILIYQMFDQKIFYINK